MKLLTKKEMAALDNAMAKLGIAFLK